MKIYKFLIMSLLFSGSSLFASDGVCHRCELIREENAKHTNPYPYYEDYLKAQENKDNKVEKNEQNTKESILKQNS